MSEPILSKPVSAATQIPVVASSTGKPMIPPAVVPYLIGVCTIAEIAAVALPSESIWSKIAHIVAGGCLMLGIASPGLRRKV